MALTAKQLIEFLQKYPEDSEIEVLKFNSGGYECYVNWMNIKDENLDYCDGIDVLDFRKITDKDSPFYGKVYIRLGEQ